MRVWFVTGASRGLGRKFAITALERGDLVAATARNTDTLADLVDTYGDAVLPMRLDVTYRAAAVGAVDRAHDHFGRLDVVVNNAGSGQYGFVEELSEAELRAQMETNFFGAVWVTQAALPHLRARGRGHIVQVSSIGGVTAFPNLAGYHASKWALEGFSQSLAQEVEPFGIRVTPDRTRWFQHRLGGLGASGRPPSRLQRRAPEVRTRPHRTHGEVGSARGSRISSAEGRGLPRPAAAGVLRGEPAQGGPRRLLQSAGHLGTVAAPRGCRAGLATRQLQGASPGV
jgi:NAD(P)-dependent dehydrogenase (short-subunit alcohol dehydrogenase family)